MVRLPEGRGAERMNEQLSTAAGYEVELCIGNEVLELSAWLPLNLHVSDVLSGELVCFHQSLSDCSGRSLEEITARSMLDVSFCGDKSDLYICQIRSG